MESVYPHIDIDIEDGLDIISSEKEFLKDFTNEEDEDQYEVFEDQSHLRNTFLDCVQLFLSVLRRVKNHLYRVGELVYYLTDPSTDFKIQLHKDIEYYTGSDKHHHKHKLNIYIPEPIHNKDTINKFPVVIHIHGGGWARGDRNIWFYGAPLMGSAYCKNGFIAVVPSYRLVQTASHPAQIQDVARAIRWVWDNIEFYGGDKSHIFLSGHSAGGHLVSLVSLDTRWLAEVGLPVSVIKGVVSISGIYNLHTPLSVPNGNSIKYNFYRKILIILWNSVFHKIYVKPTFGRNSQAWTEASPIEHITPNAPAFLVINAQFDLGLELGGKHFVEELVKKGVSVQHEFLPMTSHGSVTRTRKTADTGVQFMKKLMYKRE